MKTASKVKRLLSLKETAAEFGPSLWFWRERVWRREVPVVVVGRTQLLDRRDIEAFISAKKALVS